jgi:hypothetical protein
MNPTPTQVSLDWSVFVGPALVAAVVTAFITVWLHFRTVKREDRYRFTADKRAAYSELVTSFAEARAIITYDDVQDGELLQRAMEELIKAGPSPELLRLVMDEHKTNVRRTQDRAYRVRERTAAAFGVVVLLAPLSVRVAAADVMELVAEAERFGADEGQEAITRLISVMRVDLGAPFEDATSEPDTTDGPVSGAGAQTWSSGSMRIDGGTG